MAPRKRTNAVTKEQQKKLDIFLSDFDKQRATRIQDIERQAKNLCKQVTSYYVQEICKLPKATREMKLEAFLAGMGPSITTSLGKIEEEINNAIQLPTVGKKLRTGTKPIPSSALRAAKVTPAAALPPAPPSKSTVRKKRINTDAVDMETVEEIVVVKTEHIVKQTCLVASTPLPESGDSSTGISNKTFNFDEVSPESGPQPNGDDITRTKTSTPKIDLDLTRTIKKDDIVNENVPATLKKNFTTATVCRKAIPNEILWSDHGSPVVIDPRTALAQSKVQAAILVKTGAIAITGSPMSDAAQCPQLDSTDIDLMKKLHAKMAKMIEINENRVSAAERDEPGTSKD